MKIKAEIIEHLNKILGNELCAVNQYFLHARICDDWGLGALGKQLMAESLEEMRHADELIKRILFLEGHVNMDVRKPQIGQDVRAIIESDLALEMVAHPDLIAAVQCSEQLGDFVSRDLFQKILDAEEEHIDWLETQLGLIDKLGIKNYLQAQLGGPGQG